MAEEKKDLGELLTLRQEICSQRGFARQLQEDGFGLTNGLRACLNCPANKQYADATGCRYSSFDGENNQAQKPEEPQKYVEMRCLACNEKQVFEFEGNTGLGPLYTCPNCQSLQFYHQGEKK